MIDGWLSSIGSAIGGAAWLAPLLALLAGVLTSFSPCSLSSVPLVIAYVGGADADAKRALRLSLVFAAGMALTFTALGTAAALAGRLLSAGQSWWYLLLGALMLAMSLQMFGIINILPATTMLAKNTKRGYAGAFAAGVLGGLFASPCATPVLVALLAVIAQQGNLAWGILLMLLYGVGHGALSVVAGSSIGFVNQLSQSKGYEKFSKWFNIGMGVLILLIGLYMLYLGF